MFRFVDYEIHRKEIGIYQIRNTVSGLVYIGQTRESFAKRYTLHRCKLRNNQHDNAWLQASYNKYGEDVFEFSVLIAVDDPETLDDLERTAIAEARKQGHCCNIADGGGGAPGVPLSPERRRELGELNKKLNTGKKASDETKAKMSAVRLGKRRPEGMADKMIATRTKKILNGEQLKTTKLTPEQVAEIKIALMENISWEDLSNAYGVSESNINAIRSNRSWRFVEVEGWDEYCKTHIHNTRARQSRGAN